MRRVLLAVTLIACISGTAAAQTINPRAVAFTASADHNVIWTPEPGQPGTPVPVLSHYLLEIDESGVAIRTTDLGKPTPAATTNEIQTPLERTGLLQNHTYTVYVIAVGPGGNARSAEAGPIKWTVPAGVTRVTIKP